MRKKSLVGYNNDDDDDDDGVSERENEIQQNYGGMRIF